MYKRQEKLQTETKEFFDGELHLLDKLISEAKKLQQDDRKLQLFLDQIITPIKTNNNDEKVLIFTEYRTTQLYLKTALEKRYGVGSVELINGSIAHASSAKQ